MIIEKIINFPHCSLAVFYTRGRAWQYSILFFDDLSFYSPTEIYYTKGTAERIGREAIRMNLGR